MTNDPAYFREYEALCDEITTQSSGAPREYQQLMLSVLDNAIRSCFRGEQRKQVRGLWELMEWVTTEDEARYRYAFSFEFVCGVLEISTPDLREKMLNIVHRSLNVPGYHETMAQLCAPMHTHTTVRTGQLTTRTKRFPRRMQRTRQCMARKNVKTNIPLDVARLVLGRIAFPA